MNINHHTSTLIEIDGILAISDALAIRHPSYHLTIFNIITKHIIPWNFLMSECHETPAYHPNIHIN